MHTIAMLPEWMMLGIVGILFLSVFVKKESNWNRLVFLAVGVVIAMIFSIRLFDPSAANTTFYSSLIYDSLTNISRLLIALAFLATFLFIIISHDRSKPARESYLLLAFSVLGAFVAVSANEFITLYVGLELLAIPSYILVALNDEAGIKVALKYLFTALIASAFLLLGIGFLSGVCGSTIIGDSCALTTNVSMANLVPLFFIILGVGFKAGLVPTQGWMPDAYAGSSTYAAHMLATLPKIVGITVLFRILAVSGVFHLPEISYLVFIIAAGSIVFGSTVAILQKNFRKLLAYAGIAHMGFMFFTVMVEKTGFEIFSWYLFSYVVATIGVFAYLIFVSSSRNQDEISEHQGMLQERPVIAFSAIILLLSFAGLPPTLGFWAKFSLVLELLRAQNIMMNVAAVLTLLFTVVGFYYYLMVIKTIITPQNSSEGPSVQVPEKRILQWIVVGCAGILLLGGILPEQTLNLLG